LKEKGEATGNSFLNRRNLFLTITDTLTVVEKKLNFRFHNCDIFKSSKMLYFWITNAVKKSRTPPPGSVSGPGFFFGGSSSISGSEKQKSLSLMSLNSATKHVTMTSSTSGHQAEAHHHYIPKHLRKKLRSSSISSVA
jgi:hypothetical protein